MEEMFGKNKKDTNEGINKRRNKKEKKQEREETRKRRNKKEKL